MSRDNRTCTKTEAGDAPTTARLCLDCALCCDGTLFPAAEVSPRDAARLSDMGFAITSGSNGPTFALPCRKLDGRRCGIYAERPSLCSSFRCRLLAKLAAGEIDLAQAGATVARARQLQAAAAAAQSDAATVAGRTAWRKARTADAAAGAQHDAAGLLASISLDWYLDAHFRNKPALSTRRSNKPKTS